MVRPSAYRAASILLPLSKALPAVARALLPYQRQPDTSPALHVFTKRAEHDASFIVQAIMIPVLVLLSGVFAGLTLGYMSLDETQLHVLSVSGSPKQQKYAKQIAPLRKDGHLLLITLLLANMIVNETLPVVSDNVLGGGIQAVVISTVLIVIFSEIIPQSVCSRYGLVIGAKMAIPTRCLTYLFFPVGWPVAKLLELVLGPHQGIIYRRQELKELINMHLAGEGGYGGDLAGDTVHIVGGALDFQVKTVREAMTPLEEVFYLDADAKLDYETLARVVRSGHSRIPIFERTPDPASKQEHIKCLGILLVKQCVLLDPEDATPVRSIPLNKIPIVPYDEPLLGLLDRFQEGRSHMALVSRVPRREEPKVQAVVEDGEEQKEVKESLTRRFLNRFGKGESDEEEGGDDESTAVGEAEKGEKAGKAEGKARKEGARWGNHLEQAMPADAVLDEEGAERFLKNLEGNPLGIITLEDVLEELIGEEILDEFDLTGAQALPASTFVPEEAKRAVDAADKARAKADWGRAKRVAQGLRIVKRTKSGLAGALSSDGPGEGEGLGMEKQRSEPVSAVGVELPSPPGEGDAPTPAGQAEVRFTQEPETIPPPPNVATPLSASVSEPPSTGAGVGGRQVPRTRKSVFKSENAEGQAWREGLAEGKRKGGPPSQSGQGGDKT